MLFKGEHKLRREIFLPVKELVLIDKYTPSIRFWSLSLFVNVHWNSTSHLSLGPSVSCSLAMCDIMLVLLPIGHWRLTELYVCCIQLLIITNQHIWLNKDLWINMMCLSIRNGVYIVFTYYSLSYMLIIIINNFVQETYLGLIFSDQWGARPTWCNAYLMGSWLKDQEKPLKELNRRT